MSLYDIYEAHKEEQDKARAEADRLKEQAQLATGKVADSVLDAINSGSHFPFPLPFVALHPHPLFFISFPPFSHAQV